MFTEKQFIDTIGSHFWRHIISNTELEIKPPLLKREPFLKQLYKKLVKMSYVPSLPRGYIVAHKSNNVVRFIPVLTLEDYCVYFFCVKSLESELANNRVPNTFGGWRLGGKIRKLEDSETPDSTSDNSYRRDLWFQAWQDFQKRSYTFSRRKKNRYFFKIDLANFYDSIRIDHLEKKIRAVTSSQKTDIVNLLIYFLQNCNKKDLSYEQQSVGVPQDEVGDCSRILANFYLQDYDKKVTALSSKYHSDYLRYADDQIFAAFSKNTVKKIMFLASKELNNIGLNLNAHKATLFARKDFSIYWSFDLHKKLSLKNNKKKEFNEVVDSFINRDAETKSLGKTFRKDTLLRRFLSSKLENLNANNRIALKNYYFNESFLTSASTSQLCKLYFQLDAQEKKELVSLLNQLSKDVLFNQFHLRVLIFARKAKIPVNDIQQVKTSLDKLKKRGFC